MLFYHCHFLQVKRVFRLYKYPDLHLYLQLHCQMFSLRREKIPLLHSYLPLLMSYSFSFIKMISFYKRKRAAKQPPLASTLSFSLLQLVCRIKKCDTINLHIKEWCRSKSFTRFIKVAIDNYLMVWCVVWI